MSYFNSETIQSKRGIGRAVISLILIVLITWALVAFFLPSGPSYSLMAITEQIELEVAQSPAPLGWGGLEVRKIDGVAASCSIDAFPIGSVPLKIKISASSKRLERSADSAVQVEVRLQGAGSVLSLPCARGKPREARNAVILESTRSGPPLTLLFAGAITAGASPDSQGGESRILLSGTLRATEKLKGSTQPGASGQYELLAGDTVSIAAQLPEKVAATGLIWRDEDGLKLVAHATQARVTIDRLGVGRLEEITLRPGLLAVMLANPTFLLLCTLLATALTFLPTVENYMKRVMDWFSSPIRTRADDKQENA